MADRHPGITMHKITFGGGFIGLLFAAGSALIFVLGFPTLWYFVALAFILGVGIAIVLGMVHERSSNRNKPLSILGVAEHPDVTGSSGQDSRRMSHLLPKIVSA